jgi:hypothetical protein
METGRVGRHDDKQRAGRVKCVVELKVELTTMWFVANHIPRKSVCAQTVGGTRRWYYVEANNQVGAVMESCETKKRISDGTDVVHATSE